MRIFETLWDWLAGEKSTLGEPKAGAQSGAQSPPPEVPQQQTTRQRRARAETKTHAPSHATTVSSPSQGTTLQPLHEPIARPRTKRKTQAPAAPLAQPSTPASEALPPRTQPASLAAQLPLSRKELERVMCLPAANGSLPAVPEKFPRALRDRYELAMRAHLDHYGIRVRKWRRSSSGIAWCVAYRSGRVQRLIESPRPLTPLSCAIFLHEVGHHAIGLGIHHPRCLEEYLAWMYSLQQMQAWGIEISPRVQQRVHRSLRYAVRKAVRRGIRELPKELEPYRH